MDEQSMFGHPHSGILLGQEKARSTEPSNVDEPHTRLRERMPSQDRTPCDCAGARRPGPAARWGQSSQRGCRQARGLAGRGVVAVRMFSARRRWWVRSSADLNATELYTRSN